MGNTYSEPLIRTCEDTEARILLLTSTTLNGGIRLSKHDHLVMIQVLEVIPLVFMAIVKPLVFYKSIVMYHI